MRGNQQQKGIALIVSLIILLLLTIIMVSALRVTTLEEKMSGNSQDSNIAFQAAESALREAEAYLQSGAFPFNPLKLSGAPFRDTSGETVCGTEALLGLCSETTPLQSTLFPNVNGGKIVANTGIVGISAEPEYIIELIRTDPSVDSSRVYATFRITTRAWGEEANTVVRLQSTFRVHAISFTH
jgi:type IV pilus assembly protein PilX